MQHGLLQRFSDWIGHWAGNADFHDGASGLLQVEVAPLFEGDALEVRMLLTDRSSKTRVTDGCGFWHLNRDGRVRASICGDWTGAVELVEQAGSTAELSLEGRTDDGARVTVAWSLHNGELSVDVGVHEAEGAGVRARATGRLRRQLALLATL